MMHRNRFEYVDDDWQTQAACRDTDPDLFFVFSEKEQLKIAAIACGGCAVRAVCLEFALETNQIHGVWGGKTEAERHILSKDLIRQRRQAT